MTFHSKRVKEPRPCEQRVVSSGEDARQDHRVDEAPRNIRANHFKNNGKRRGPGALRVEVWVVVGDIKPNKQH